MPSRPSVRVFALPKIGAVPMEHILGHGLASIPLSFPDALGPEGLESCSSPSSMVGPCLRPCAAEAAAKARGGQGSAERGGATG